MRKSQESAPAEGGLPEVRANLRRRLPNLMRRVVGSYDLFSAGDVPLDAKDFSAHHGAAKASLAHLEALAKLSAWAEGADDAGDEAGTAGEDRALTGLIDEARAALAAQPEDEA